MKTKQIATETSYGWQEEHYDKIEFLSIDYYTKRRL